MGRHKKNREFSFDDVFGEFDAEGANDKPNKIYKLNGNDGKVHPCNHCGDYPRVHDVFFRDKDAHQKHFYLDCDCCGECDGRMYLTEADAVEAWNEMNPNTDVPLDEGKLAEKKFYDELMENVHVAR